MGRKLRKHGDIRPVNYKDIPEKPQGSCIPPPLPVPARVRNESQINLSVFGGCV